MEGVQLKPIVGERGVRYFEETEIQPMLVRVRPGIEHGGTEGLANEPSAVSLRLLRVKFDD